MADNNYVVYRHTSPNGKMYIGITSRTLGARSGHNGYGYRKNAYFYRAIQKYGWKNFSHEILFSNLTKTEAADKEVEMIALYGTTNAQNGYNNSSGGESGSKGAKFSDETRQKMSAAHKGKPYTKKQLEASRKIDHHRKLSEETKRKISKAKLGKHTRPLSEETKCKIGDAQRGEKNHMWGYSYSEEERNQLSLSHKRRHVVSISEDGEEIEYDGLRIAERMTGTAHANIVYSIKTGKPIKGHIWRYSEG